MKTIFLGTPEFAIASLEKLLDTDWVQILAVCTQTDKEAGRGKHIKIPPVKELAIKKNLPVIQTKKIAREQEAIEKIKNLNPEILVTCAFGQILSNEILDIAPYGVINVHGSLLPKYRGAAPINWAILNGEKETGITIMKTELGLDSGPIILQKKCNINENETSIDLFKKLSILGADTLIKALELIRDGKANYILQDDLQATKAPVLKKEQGLIDWNQTSDKIHNQIRGLQPWPSAFTQFNGKTIKIWESKIEQTSGGTKGKGQSTKGEEEKSPGTIIEISDYVKVKTGDGYITIYKLQPENRNILNAKEWVNGTRIKIGDKFE